MNRREFTAVMAAAAGFGMAPAMPLLAQTAEPEALVIPDMILGNPDSKVVLTEYASFTCPHCANFHSAVFKDLKRDYIDNGKIKFVYREVYFDRYGLWAAMVARCGGEMRYFGIADILYSTQKEWAGSDDPATVVGNLKKIGLTAGMDEATLNACLNDGPKAQAMVEKYQTDTAADDISSTPSFVLNGVKHSNMGYAELAKLLDEELAK
ncbi:MAG: DsbA family protein [Pseudorhodobacter sp.]|nr:DsbA family protein [Pseudorhodobacter sp.]